MDQNFSKFVNRVVTKAEECKSNPPQSVEVNKLPIVEDLLGLFFSSMKQALRMENLNFILLHEI